ncbi:GNAT family N-acetyltransferase [Paenisporosarcina cavernae]|uniref:GNAT family N-acetyltransferase n=1 Tax=Paenisporosarcina cavernae TaxID=2320858 RepID=A0A385YT80_9BACL|nr:GNAT family N-acetyltransferase [Paenisporosarcina cavernae]AYC28683.1 GNAT family N-acetyltransferase [Paenisporosarcina cavernae]
MTIDLMTISIPIDTDTAEEVTEFLQYAIQEDTLNYELLLNMDVLVDVSARGFLCAAYKGDELVGVASAFDMIGLHVYEWSMVVHPDYRGEKIGMRLYAEVQKQLELRDANEDTALTFDAREVPRKFLASVGYHLQFSEATMQASSAIGNEKNFTLIRLVESNHPDLKKVLMQAFGDTEAEAEALIDWNLEHPKCHMFEYREKDKTIATVTAVESDHALWVTALATLPMHQGKGIGTTLLAFVKHLAAQMEKAFVLLDVELENEEALKLYERAAFTKQHQVDFYQKS